MMLFTSFLVVMLVALSTLAHEQEFHVRGTTDQNHEDKFRRLGTMSYSDSSRSVSMEDCDDEEAFPLASLGDGLTPKVLCDILQTFDSLGRGETNEPSNDPPYYYSTPSDWSGSCDAFESVDPYLCPTGVELEAVCSHLNPQLNPAVKSTYCGPLFGGMDDESESSACVEMCVNFVSKNEGNYCSFDCAPEL